MATTNLCYSHDPRKSTAYAILQHCIKINHDIEIN